MSILKYLDKPQPPFAVVDGARQVNVSWEESKTRSGLDITYKLFSGTQAIVYMIRGF